MSITAGEGEAPLLPRMSLELLPEKAPANSDQREEGQVPAVSNGKGVAGKRIGECVNLIYLVKVDSRHK